jgi:hypothetical protein
MLLKAFILPLTYLKKSWVFGATLGLVLLLFGMRIASVHAANLSVSSPNNCDTNSVIWCGANNVNDLVNRYDNGDGHNTAASIQGIYSFYGISQSDITDMNNGSLSVEAGSVNTSGDVYDSSNTKVATGAVTGGREDISGSSKEVVSGTIFYERPPSVSFAQPSLAAYVVMKDGVFDFAILASCGNPVKATPLAAASMAPTKAVTKATPTPTTPVKTPATVCSGSTVNTNSGVAAQGGDCSVNTTINEPTPTPATPVPSGTCSLDIQVNPNNPLEVSATIAPSTLNGAQYSSVSYNFGDGTVTPPSPDQEYTHTYTTAGSYPIVATTNFTSTTQSVPAATCSANLTMATPATTPVNTPVVTAVSTAPAATSLVNTGPGDVVAIFGLAVLSGSLSYHFLLKRYLN